MKFEWKKRTLEEVHERLQVLYAKREKFWEKNGEWFRDTPELFMGKHKHGTSVIFVMDHEDNSHHCEYPDYGEKWYYLALRDTELPLYVHKPNIPDNSKDIILKRLKGELKEIPIIQDLVDRKEKIDHKHNRMGHLIALYEQVLIDYIYGNRTYSKWDFTKIIILTIKGHEYIFSANSGREIRLIRPAEIQYMT